jgi:broad specificity phosphatase PhoE
LSRLVLVRHGEAAASWADATADADPGLTDRGRAQAEALADALAPIGPLPIVVSPLRRTRETAAPLEARWGVSARVEPAVGEVPAPANGDRMAWLAGLLTTPFGDWPADLRAWRTTLLDALASLAHDTVVFTHYVAIVVAKGEAGYAPFHCSQTVLDLPRPWA